jgi:hypothetical protein
VSFDFVMDFAEDQVFLSSDMGSIAMEHKRMSLTPRSKHVNLYDRVM